MTAPHAPVSTRLLWVDVAKGVCIVLVVLHHAVVKDLVAQTQVAGSAAALTPVAEAWVAATMALKPVRMPLFFLLSGLVASGAVRRPWTVAARRAWAPYYLYVIWLLLHAVFFSVERLLPMNRTQDVPELVGDLVWASTNLWFLYALAIYFVLARLLSGLPPVPVLLVAAAVAAASGLLPTDDWNRVSVVAHFVFFAAGALAPELVRRAADGAVGRTGRLAGLYLLVVAALALVGAPRTVELVVAGALGVPLGVGACMVLSRSRVAPAVAWIGRRTLPIYVMHLPVLALVLHLPNPMDALSSGRWGVVEAAAYPLVLTAASVLVTLAAHSALRWIGLSVLFETPRRRVVVREEAQATVAASSWAAARRAGSARWRGADRRVGAGTRAAAAATARLASRWAATSWALGRSRGSRAVIAAMSVVHPDPSETGSVGLRCTRAHADSSSVPAYSRRPVSASSSSRPSA